jgi:hypothetical protein
MIRSGTRFKRLSARRLSRERSAFMGGITATELRDLSCVIYHFQWAEGGERSRTLSPEAVRKVMRQIPEGSESGLLERVIFSWTRTHSTTCEQQRSSV